MRTTTAGLTLALITAVGAATTLPSAASPSTASPQASAEKKIKHRPSEPKVPLPSDSLANPLGEKQAELRQEAWADVLSGEAAASRINGTSVVKTGREPAHGKQGKKGKSQDQYVELANEGTDRVFVLLVEFGTERAPGFPDADVDPATPGPSRFDGPRFNQIPEPGANDNSTQWRANFNKSYYRDLYFGTGNKESLKTYYEKQSSGRYSVDGEVTDIVRVKYNEARYGRPFNGVYEGVPCNIATDIVCSNTWELITDAMTQWVADQKAKGRTDAQIAATVRSYDKLDRYDFDGDGNFEEPDGYIDRFQVIHAGGDQADGDPYQGEDAIWSHRWYADYTDIGNTGPATNLAGGRPIGNTGVWVGDYTIQPENGGLSVVAHEYGHDLGLPDHYDTSAAGDNPVSWWTLMAQSRVSAKGDRGIGTRAADLGVWDKLQLGWLDYEVVVAGEKAKIDLGPHEYNSKRAQGVAVVLPDKPVESSLPAPAEGVKQWWSGAGNSYTASMSRSDVAVPAAGGTLSLKVNYNIEEDYDYAYVEVQSPAGSGAWTALPTTAADPDTGTGAEPAIDGLSNGYRQLTYDLAAYSSKTIGVRVRYVTDGAVQGDDPTLGWSGILVDDIKVVSGSTTVLADGAETSPNGWTLAGFTSVGSSFTTDYDQFYLASNRAYTSYDRYLQTGPYNFGFTPDKPDLVEHFPYQNGLLVNYWDTSFSDNDTSVHPGGGLVLPVDANPKVIKNLEGVPWRGRIQNYDAPFGLEKSDSFTLHVGGKASYVRGQNAVPLFDDTDPNRYFAPFAAAGLARVGVIVAGAGVQIRVVKQDGNLMTIRVS